MNLGRVVLKNLGRVVLGRVLCGPSWHGPSWFWAELSVIRTKYRKVYGEGGGGGVSEIFGKANTCTRMNAKTSLRSYRKTCATRSFRFRLFKTTVMEITFSLF